MYMGVKSFHKLPAVRNYEDAQRALERHNGMSKRGKRKDSVNFYEDTGAIAFQLYETEVVIWHPDNSVEIDNYGSLTTSGFADRFLPSHLSLRFPVERRGDSGGDRAIRFLMPGGSALCEGALPRFREVDGYWVPDEDTIDDVTMPLRAAPRKRQTELFARYNVKDFDNWLSMAQVHLDDLEHEQVDVAACLGALEARNWRGAVATMPIVKATNSFGAADRAKPYNVAVRRDHYISASCIGKLKLAILDDAGLIVDEKRKVWLRDEYEKRKRLATELDGLTNSYGGRYGFAS